MVVTIKLEIAEAEVQANWKFNVYDIAQCSLSISDQSILKATIIITS